jgi:hypothetical protein
MKRLALGLCLFLLCFVPEQASPADIVPGAIQQPGTQPQEISNLESPDKCDNCHGGYNSSVEPAHNWRGSMMAHAGRDPIFWATMAIAEQDFDGAGDLCLRCHSTGGWLAGRSTPTDGSGLATGDSDGVECDYCHKLTNPDDSDPLLQGVMNSPFIANCGTDPNVPGKDCDSESEGFYGSGMSSTWDGSDKLGPYIDADARHQFMQSQFHRDRNFCGTCHDVSNPITGDMAHNFGQLSGNDTLVGSSSLGSPLADKAAFNYPPYRYGVVERTFSEHMSSAISTDEIEVDEYPALKAPEDNPTVGLPRGGALEAIYDETSAARGTADYEDGTTRYYTCQTCHMRAVKGTGANKRGVPVRTDLPLHDMTGGNYWMADAIKYLDDNDKLRLGGGMSPTQVQAMKDGQLRALEQLRLAATLEVDGNEVKIINHTGHKLITGYPEGRRMWLNIKWFDGSGEIPGTEIGAYGELEGVTASANGVTKTVRSIKEPDDPQTIIYQAHMGMTQGWASQLVGLGYDPNLPLGYERNTGAVEMTLGQLAGSAPGTAHESFHFALNNVVISDNRIPPYRMSYAEAKRRNASPVPANLYGAPSPDGVYEHFDRVQLDPPTGAAYATIDLLYQPTSWEYIQFLYLANKRGNAFLAEEGANMLEAWLATGMAEPVVIVSTVWTSGVAGPDPVCNVASPDPISAEALDKAVTLSWTDVGESVYRLYYDQSDKAQLIDELDCSNGECTTYTDTGLTNGQNYCYKVTAVDGSCESAFSESLCATPQNAGQPSTLASVEIDTLGRWETTGRGKNAVQVLTEVLNNTFTAGDEIGMLLLVSDQDLIEVAGATVHVTITGPSTAELSSSVSGNDGLAELHWQTQQANHKGTGGTPTGSYTARVTGISSNTYTWDTVFASVEFEITN